jgi:hypothetical protein
MSAGIHRLADCQIWITNHLTTEKLERRYTINFSALTAEGKYAEDSYTCEAYSEQEALMKLINFILLPRKYRRITDYRIFN